MEPRDRLRLLLYNYPLVGYLAWDMLRGCCCYFWFAYTEGARNLHFFRLMLISRLFGSIQIPTHVGLQERVK